MAPAGSGYEQVVCCYKYGDESGVSGSTLDSIILNDFSYPHDIELFNTGVANLFTTTCTNIQRKYRFLFYLPPTCNRPV